jgi:hypothetical protein
MFCSKETIVCSLLVTSARSVTHWQSDGWGVARSATAASQEVTGATASKSPSWRAALTNAAGVITAPDKSRTEAEVVWAEVLGAIDEGDEATVEAGTAPPSAEMEDAECVGVPVESEATDVDAVAGAEVAGTGLSGDCVVGSEVDFDEGGDMAVPRAQIRTRKQEAE